METPWEGISEQEMYRSKGIIVHDSMHRAPLLNINLFTKIWLPAEAQPEAVICMIHGYGHDISWTFQNMAIHFASVRHWAAVAVDLQGHGKSDGLRAFVPSVETLARDCASIFQSICENKDYPLQDLPRFLYGESMGGAICLLIHLGRYAEDSASEPNSEQNPESKSSFWRGAVLEDSASEPNSDQNPESKSGFWRGAVLVAPMCRISDRIRPSWPVAKILIAAAWLLPTLAIVPMEDLVEKCVKTPEKRRIARSNPRRYTGKPRLGTSLELLRVTDYLNSKLPDVDIPFIVLHGDADVVTDPNISRELYDTARSEDKTLKIYEGLGHSLLFGEDDEKVEGVRNDICDWIAKRI